jgi:hypothetical protein
MLIGLHGVPGSGKSEFAKYLHQKYDFAHVNIGDAMKAMLRGFYSEICGIDDKEINRRLYGDLKRVPDNLLNGKTPTHAMQTIGYEWRDTISKTLFSDRWADRVRKHKNVVADGMRYPDEMPVFYELDGLMIRMIRPGYEDTTGHPAENQKLPADVIIHNDGTIEDLYRKADMIVSGRGFSGCL